MERISGAVAFCLLVTLGFSALRLRGRPTVWTGVTLRWILLGLAGLLVALTRLDLIGLIGALWPLGAGVLLGRHPHDFLVLFARPDTGTVVAVILDRLGVPYEVNGRAFRVLKPTALLMPIQLPCGAYWMSLKPMGLTPKLKLMEGVLHKFLSN